MRELQELLSRQMTRKEFIKLLLVALLTMLGVNNFVAMLSKRSQSSSRQVGTVNDQTSHGFGSRKFGA